MAPTTALLELFWREILAVRRVEDLQQEKLKLEARFDTLGKENGAALQATTPTTQLP